MSDTLSSVPVLETARLRLRTIRRDDLDAIYRLHSDPRAMRYWSFAPWTDRQQAQDWFEQRQGEHGEVWPWAVTLHDDDTLCGGVTLFAVNRSQHRAEIGYQLQPSHWGRGSRRRPCAPC